MKIFGAVIVALSCLCAPARAAAPAYGELNDELFSGVKKRMTNGKAIKAVYIPAKDSNAGKPGQAVEWVPLGNFEMSKTLVTMEQYVECVNTVNPVTGKAWCTKPDTGGFCNWGKTDRDRMKDPVNCVNYEQADAYAKFMGARLPREPEWKYVATSGGKNQKYPWGNSAPTCGDHDGKNGNAVMRGNGGFGCGNDSTMPVCSKPAGNTAQGLCDMVGNVWQWVQGKDQGSGANAPADGSRVVFGGCFLDEDVDSLSRPASYVFLPGKRYAVIGFRLAKSIRD